MGKLAEKCDETSDRNPRKFNVYAKERDEKTERLDDRYGRSHFSNGGNSFYYHWSTCQRSNHARGWYHRTSGK